jgi:hypothetical protein
MTNASQPPSDQKAWAHKILKRHKAGEKINPTALAMARIALGLPTKE